MSKLSFRARALDATKPLPIYHAVDLPDLSEYNTINRTVPQMPTGMEKEEETERHLQDVIIAQQNNCTSKRVIIPTPENAITVPYYREVTATADRPPMQYIRQPGLTLDEEVPDYDLDTEDEEWLSLQTDEKPLSPLHFERMMDKLEKGSGNTVLSEREAQALLKDDEDLVLAVYDYWLAKRLRLGRSLIPVVKQERRDGSSSGSNPYLAFRKRTEKMQTRKNRKNDETAYMQMQKLKRDLDKAFTLSGLIKEREAKKHELAQVHMDIFKNRYLLEDWSGSIMTSLCPVATRSATSRQNSNVSESAWDGGYIKVEGGDDYDIHQVGRHEVLVSSGLKRKRKKKYYYLNNSTESPLPPVPSTPDKMNLDPSRDLSSDKLHDDEYIDGKFTFKRKPHVKYHFSHERFVDWPWNDEQESPLSNGVGVDAGGSDGETEYGSFTTRVRMPRPKKLRYSQLTMSRQFVGLGRRRVGRGGRVIVDRCFHDLNDEDAMITDSNEMDITEQSATSSPVPPTDSTPLVNGTPLNCPHTSTTANTPSSLLRQQSEIMCTPVTTGEKSTELLLRSQSVQLPSTSRILQNQQGGRVTAAAAVGGGSAEGERIGRKKNEVKRNTPPKRSLHFVDKTPSPTSKFELPSLPFIVQPHPFPGSIEHAQTPEYHPEGAFGTENFSLRRLPSFSDYREEMMTFSSLPTSHFTLRPSSSDTELDDPPNSYWEKSSSNRMYDSDPWNWNHPSLGMGMWNERSWQRWAATEASNIGDNSSNNHSPALPSPNLSYGGIPARPNTNKSTQQVPSQEDSSSKDMSRSSLSVTDSKTIVLTNAPASWQSGGNKKKETEKALSHQQRNHKLVGHGNTGLKPPVVPQEENPLVEGSNHRPVQESGSPSNGVKAQNSSSNAENKLSEGEVEGNKPALSSKETVQQQTKVETNGTAQSPLDSGSGTAQKQQKVAAGNSNESSNDTSSVSSGVKSSEVLGSSLPQVKKSGTSGDSNVKKTEKPKEVDVWSRSGPSNGILSLNVRSRKDKIPQSKKTKKSEFATTAATLESALLITSQFVTKSIKKEESVPNSDILPPLGGISVRSSSSSSRSASSTPTILNSTDVPNLKLAGLGSFGNAVTGFNTTKLTELQSPVAGSISTPPPVAMQENAVTQGADVKRNNSISDGLVSHVTGQGPASVARHPNTPTGTNGTNYQELFTATKRMSENTERGLKQALAGTVVNHNSLLETAAKSLVPQTLKNSSEVT